MSASFWTRFPGDNDQQSAEGAAGDLSGQRPWETDGVPESDGIAGTEVVTPSRGHSVSFR
jgi:hypothetical protein